MASISFPALVRRKILGSGQDGVYVSRLRKDLTKENGFNFWVVSDNLLKGAALNSVQIAESLIKVGRV